MPVTLRAQPKLVVHAHFHPRRTGVTAHVEQVVRALAQTLEARAVGQSLAVDVPLLSWSEVQRRALTEDLVWHAHRNNELLWGLLLRTVGRRVRVVVTRHGSNVPGWFSQWLYQFADAVVTLNEEVRQMVRVPSTVIHHGVALTHFQPPESRAEAWQALQQSRRYGIGVIGRIRPEKGQGDFVEALAPLASQFNEWQPVLVGSHRDAPAGWLESLQSKLHGGLSLPGETSEVLRWYQGLQVVVQPSHREAFSMVWLESMAAGACLVASALPAVKTVVEHERTGLLYPVGDVAALRECLSRVMRDPGWAAQLGANAAEAARARFGIEHEVAALLGVYSAQTRS